MDNQLTLIQDWQDPIQTHLGNPTPEYNTQDMHAQITADEIQNKSINQKEKIMELLTNYDRWPSDNFPKIGLSQYNARINEINKELAGAKRPDGSYEQICTHYDPEERRYYKRLELIKDD